MSNWSAPTSDPIGDMRRYAKQLFDQSNAVHNCTFLKGESDVMRCMKCGRVESFAAFSKSFPLTPKPQAKG